jgi:DNA ligase 1
MEKVKPMLAKPFNEAKLSKEVVVQPKFNGVRCLAYIYADGRVELRSRNDNEYTSSPHINEELSKLKVHAHLGVPLILDGELYLHGVDFDTISGIARLKNSRGAKPLEYHIFDICINDPFVDRTYVLNAIFQVYTFEWIKLCDNYMIEKESINEMLYLFIHKGYEGIIIRNPKSYYEQKRSYNLMKLKPTKTDVYKIEGFVEEMSIHDEPKDRLGAFICMKDGEAFTVGSGLTDAQRTEIWNNKGKYINKYIVVRYQDLTKRGIPRFGVFVEIIEGDKDYDVMHND